MIFAMVIESSASLFDYYHPWAVVLYWLQVLVVLGAFGLVAGLVVNLSRLGFRAEAVIQTIRGFFGAVTDVLLLPFGLRRVGAIAKLTFKEAIRRRILYVFVLFLLPFLFAGWYLPNSEEGQLQSLVAFVTNAMTWLLVPLVVFMVSMSFPNDLKQRTIQTVVTKPIRRLEIVVGRVVGFMAIYTMVLLIMGTVSLIYLRGQVSDKVRETQWKARVPVVSSQPDYISGADGNSYPLMFYKNGILDKGGTNVGKEWAYRSHIEGATSDSAIWYFDVDPTIFAGRQTVPMELTFNVYKTTKGDPTREGAEGAGVWCLLQIVDPQNRSAPAYSQTFRVDNMRRKRFVDVPADVFKGGKVEVVAQCLTRNQFLGMAPYDLYFLATERSFDANFIKGLTTIWLKVLLLTCLAVAASTVLNGFVTALLVTMVYILGFFYTFMMGIITGEVAGGGPIESAIRLYTQNNQTTALEPGLFTTITSIVDKSLLWIMERLARVIPDLTTLDTASYVAQGFDIPDYILIRNVVIVLGYVVPVVIAGFLLLKSREIAA